jgi:immune inhibitor A
VDEEIDLSAYAGSRILLRFEYVTDEATVEDGLALDDLSITEIGLRDDAETDGGWHSSGFLRVADTLPQRFIAQVVELDDRDVATVRRIDLDAANDAEIVIPRTARRATIVLSGATLGTTQPAPYRWEVRR